MKVPPALVSPPGGEPAPNLLSDTAADQAKPSDDLNDLLSTSYIVLPSMTVDIDWLNVCVQSRL